MMQMLSRLWSRLPPAVQGSVCIAVATFVWLLINYLALWALQHIEHNLVQGLHLILHLAFLGVMVWIEMQIGDFVARWSGAELVSKIRQKPVYVAGILSLLVLTSGYVVCFGLCNGVGCREGLAKALISPPFQPAEWNVIAVLVACTFLLRGYAWALHHAEIQHARKSASRQLE